MPMYDFQCKDCGKNYQDLTKYDENDVYPDTVCPYCGSGKKTKLLSLIAAIPVDSHDRRFWHKIEKERGNREAAEAAQGASPYNSIDDISGGQFFGEVE
jgi:putative FmdB family regulatory protein